MSLRNRTGGGTHGSTNATTLPRPPGAAAASPAAGGGGGPPSRTGTGGAHPPTTTTTARSTTGGYPGTYSSPSPHPPAPPPLPSQPTTPGGPPPPPFPPVYMATSNTPLKETVTGTTPVAYRASPPPPPTPYGSTGRSGSGNLVSPVHRPRPSYPPYPGVVPSSPFPMPNGSSTNNNYDYNNNNTNNYQTMNGRSHSTSSIMNSLPPQYGGGYPSMMSGNGAVGYAAAASATNAGNSTTTRASYGGPSSNDYAFAQPRVIDYDDDKYTKKSKTNTSRKKNGKKGGPSDDTNNSTMTMLSVLAGLGLFCTVAALTMWLSVRGETHRILKQLDQSSLSDVVTQVETLQRDIRSKEAQIQRSGRANQSTKQNQQQVNTLERQNKLLTIERDEWKKKYDQHTADESHVVHVDHAEHKKRVKDHERLTKREGAFLEQVKWLMDATRRESKRSVLERFGPGPHKVEITFAVGTVEYYRTTQHFAKVDPSNGAATTTTTDEEEDPNATKTTVHVHDNRPRFSFIVELAPLDVVPHAVHLFLEQVDHGLLNGTYFYLNGPHIVQAGPQNSDGDDSDWEWVDHSEDIPTAGSSGGGGATMGASAALARSRSRSMDESGTGGDGGTQDEMHRRLTETTMGDGGSAADANPTYNDGSNDEGDGTDDYYSGDYDGEDYGDEDWSEEDDRMKKFSDLGLDRLAFPDYNASYPHLTWTLGYTGRPGGPDWYINKVNNTDGHGPGGQHQYTLSEQGDACFGTVSAEGMGRQYLAQQVFQQEIYADGSEWNFFLKEPVEIVGAVVLTKQPQVEKIHLGPGLHPHHHHHHHLRSPPHNHTTQENATQPQGGIEQDFVFVLRDAADGTTAMTPMDGGDPKSAPTATGQNNNNVNNNDKQQDHQGRESSPPTEQGSADTIGQEHLDRPEHHRRRPRLPKIEGAAEA